MAAGQLHGAVLARPHLLKAHNALRGAALAAAFCGRCCRRLIRRCCRCHLIGQLYCGGRGPPSSHGRACSHHRLGVNTQLRLHCKLRQ